MAIERKITKNELNSMKILADDGKNQLVDIDGDLYNVVDGKWIHDDTSGWNNL